MSSKIHHSHGKPTRLTWYFFTAGILALSSLLSPAQAEEDLLAGLFSGDPTETKRLIVVLKMPDTESEAGSGTRSKRAATRARRDAVKSVQDKFLREFTCPGDEISCPMSGATVKSKFKYTPAVVAEVNEAAAKAIGKMNMVASVEVDALARPILSDSTPLIGADTVWAQGYSGAGQAVAVLDTGVDKTHPALAGKVVAEACYSTISAAYNATTVCPNGLDEQEGYGAGVDCDSSVHGCSHGTHVAGIVAANGSVQGVARDADIIAIQVFSRFDSATLCSSSGGPPCALSFTSAQIAGLERVLELHNSGMTIAAVNMSLGGGNYPDVCSGAIQSIIDQLRAVGIATIAASGNNGYKDGIASPACISSAISVGATDKSDNVADMSNSADILDLLAPGLSINSTMPGGIIGTKSGTSMAAPHVAGAWAVLKQAASTASVDDILKLLKNTGKRIEDSRDGIPNPPRITPRINLARALKRLAPADTAPNIQVAPTSYDFGNVTIGESPTVTVTIENTGDSDLKLGQLNLAGTDFAIRNDNCSNTAVTAGNTCTIKVTFAPQTEGAKNATLSIPSNDSDTATATVTLTGNGIAAVVLVPDISITPTSHDFGDVEVGESPSVTVTISNTGDSDLELGQLNLAGTDFAIRNDNCANTAVTAGNTCTIKVSFAPQTEGAKNATLSIPSNDPDTATATVTLTGNGIANEVVTPAPMPTPTPAPASCQLYAVNDQGLNNSQFFTISLDDFSISKLGPLYKGCDIEAFAICPKNNMLYAASGDDVADNPDPACRDHEGNGRKGHLYLVDGETGELVSIGDTGFNEIEGLAFSADCNTLWAWAKGDGLITIDTTTGKGTLHTPAPNMLIEDLAYDNDNTVFYGAAQTDLWKYDPVAPSLEVVCTNLPGETEALEMMHDGNLLLGTHKNKTLGLHLFNPNTCQVIIGADIPTGQFDDAEGIALPIEACTK
jgi:subtilisin family serine protease